MSSVARLPLGKPSRRIRRPQIDEIFALVPIAAARRVVDDASRWLSVPLPERYATRLAFQARRCYAHSDSFRAKLRRPGNRGRDMLYLFMRHWLAARFHAERPALYARLPSGYAVGAPFPPPAHLSRVSSGNQKAQMAAARARRLE